MRTTHCLDWPPLLFAVAGVLLTLILAWAPHAQAVERLFQTVPTPTEQTTLPPGGPNPPSPPGGAETPTPADRDRTPTPGITPGTTPGASPGPAGTAASTQAVPSPRSPALRAQISRPDVLPGDEIEIRLWLSNDTASAVTGIILTDPLDAAFDLLRVRASQGTAQVDGSSVVVRMGTLEAGEEVLVILDVRIGVQVRAGQIILNQATAYFDGGRVLSNVVAAGLPPVRLPATGIDRRRP